MSLTPSTMLPLGAIATDFTLMDSKTGKMLGLTAVQSKIATVIMFICNHCPYVIHVQHELVKLAKDYQAQGITFVAISANDVVSYPEDSPENMWAPNQLVKSTQVAVKAQKGREGIKIKISLKSQVPSL